MSNIQVIGDNHSLEKWFEDDKIKVHFEWFGDGVKTCLFVHCDVKKKSVSAIRKLKEKAIELSSYFKEKGIEEAWGYTQNNYIERTFNDWKFVQNFDHEGERFKLYEWVSKH